MAKQSLLDHYGRVVVGMSEDDIEQLIHELRTLADEAGDDADRRKQEIDLSEVDTSHMALAEKQGMRQAFQQAWRLAISKREEDTEGDRDV